MKERIEQEQSIQILNYSLKQVFLWYCKTIISDSKPRLIILTIVDFEKYKKTKKYYIIYFILTF